MCIFQVILKGRRRSIMKLIGGFWKVLIDVLAFVAEAMLYCHVSSCCYW